MKTLAPGAMGIVVASYVYLQAYNVAIDLVKRMNVLMDGAVAQLTAIDPSTTPPAAIPMQHIIVNKSI
jgi:hypothetical protein